MALKNIPYLFLPVYLVSGFRCQVSGFRIYEYILCNNSEFLIFIDLKILHVHIIAMGHIVFHLILTPET